MTQVCVPALLGVFPHMIFCLEYVGHRKGFLVTQGQQSEPIMSICLGFLQSKSDGKTIHITLTQNYEVAFLRLRAWGWPQLHLSHSPRAWRNPVMGAPLPPAHMTWWEVPVVHLLLSGTNTAPRLLEPRRRDPGAKGRSWSCRKGMDDNLQTTSEHTGCRIWAHQFSHFEHH